MNENDLGWLRGPKGKIAAAQQVALGDGLVIRISLATHHIGEVIARGLGESGYRFCTSANYLREHGAPNDPADLGGHGCLIMRADSRPARWQLIGPGGARTATIEPRAVVDDFTTLHQIVLDGAGIALLPDYLWHDQDDARLIPILPGWSLPPREFTRAIPAIAAQHRRCAPSSTILLKTSARCWPALRAYFDQAEPALVRAALKS